MKRLVLPIIILVLLLAGCAQRTQNKYLGIWTTNTGDQTYHFQNNGEGNFVIMGSSFPRVWKEVNSKLELYGAGEKYPYAVGRISEDNKVLYVRSFAGSEEMAYEKKTTKED